MAGIQSHLDALSVGGAGRASTATTPPASDAAFAGALAQQLGAQQLGTSPDVASLAAALGGTAGPATGGLATALAGAPATTPAEPAFTTTTTSLSSDGLTQLLAALPGARPAAPPAASPSAAPVTAVEAASAPKAPPSVVGKLDAKGVPLDLKAYGNGKVPEDQLVEIGRAGSGERLWGPAAAAFDEMAAAARADGVSFRINDSYRSYEDQVSMAERKGLRSQGGLAAAPGTSSHGWGMAVDLGLDGRAQSWMRENAGAHGFAETVSGEPWHWGFRPKSA
ncbi:M15 family metallopeptidase [uncultured Pseudokineococcus sp.]|uniref:M15 family metallopeptidase n=1 Tax=uncultured Pseudokineococcus sp. TaxID=1642928 RepID=UPI00263709DE|nr:M15 family metallopeptidase [uncultured Pseudokineococcus sp.]